MESKSDDLDFFDIPGYELKMENRKKVAKVNPGGITIAYKAEILDKIQLIATESKFVFWFTIASTYLSLEEDIVVGVVYIPPENTSYSSPGSFIQIENEYLDISRNYYYVALLGDFNGRTPDDDDFILVNERREEDDTGEYLENEIYTLDQLTIPRKRSNRDKGKNGYGGKY